MPTLTQIEASIQTLPAKEFFALAAWMADHHLKVIASDEFESEELEAQMLQALDSPRVAVSEQLFDEIRSSARAGVR